jgi:hypothetical protein
MVAMAFTPRVVLASAAVAVGVALASCFVREDVDLGGDPPDACAPDPGSGEIDAGEDSTPDTDACIGACVPRLRLDEEDDGWMGPLLLWSGPKEKAPACPDFTAGPVDEANADLVSPSECQVCTCSPPTGSCKLPSKLTAAGATCKDDGPGVEHIPFDPPASWDGACTTANAIPAGSGVQSLSIGPLQMVESGCTPGVDSPPAVTPPTVPYWKTYAFTCEGGIDTNPWACKNGGECMPPAEPLPEGFRRCVYQEGLVECPKAYPVRHVFNRGFDDGRTCSECDCGPPTGGMCSSLISVFTDSTCKVLQTASIVTSIWIHRHAATCCRPAPRWEASRPDRRRTRPAAAGRKAAR